VQSDVLEVMESMTLAGAIRTDLLDVYQICHCILGQGSYAKVHVARPCSQQHGQGHDQGNKRLTKVVAKEFISGIDGQAKRAKHEAAVLIAIGSHANIVSFHGIFASESETGRSWTLLLGYCAAGDLMKRLQKCGKLAISTVKQLAVSMLFALAHMHSMGYMHRDVKPENVLIDGTGCFVLADLGSAVRVSAEGHSVQRAAGSPGYIAPDMLNGRHYDERADLYSLGATLYVCICGRQLFSGDSIRYVLKSNTESNIDLNLYASKYLNAAGVEFLTKLLAKESAPEAICTRCPWARVAQKSQWARVAQRSQ